MTVRAYTPEDFPAVCRIYLDAKRAELQFEPGQFEFTPLEQDAGILAAFKESEVLVYEDGEIQGFSATFDGQLRALFVQGGARGKGIGHALLNAVIAKTANAITLNVARSNEGAIRFYERNGFTLTVETTRQYSGIEVRYAQMQLARNSLVGVDKAAAARHAGRHEEALELVLESFARADESHVPTMFTWRLLLDEYAPAREAMVRERDAQVAQLLAGELNFGRSGSHWQRSRFRLIIGMNNDLQDQRATYELFLRLLTTKPEAVRDAVGLALPAIVEAGNYALAESYLDDPLPRLDELNTLADDLPLFPMANVAPRLAAELHNFMREVSMLAAVHRGLGRDAQADALPEAALAGLKRNDIRTWAARELADPGMLFREIARVEIRCTTEDDWQELKRIRLAALLDAPTAFGVSHASAVAYTDEAWRDRAAGRGPARYILAFEGNEAIGIVAHVPDEKQELNLIAMWVAPSQRGTSTAGRLVDAVKTYARNHGHARIVLDVAPGNQRASAFYQKQGFVFLPEWDILESHPHIQVQKMAWTA
ncbi:GNAT family N-acetyltransferase [Duganella radicis]|nr:GNAT family N-acetyltransferase [Duganella radicis]